MLIFLFLITIEEACSSTPYLKVWGFRHNFSASVTERVSNYLDPLIAELYDLLFK